jgi:hypothetical protein
MYHPVKTKKKGFAANLEEETLKHGFPQGIVFGKIQPARPDMPQAKRGHWRRNA